MALLLWLPAILYLTSCASVPEAPSVPGVTRANGVLRLTRAEVDAMLSARGAALRTPSGKRVARRGADCRLEWTEHAVPVVSGKERVGPIDRYDGTAELTRGDLEALRRLMEEARVRAKGVRVPLDPAAPTLVRCDARQCAIDLLVEATATSAPPVATYLRKRLEAQPVEAATSGTL
jgi:hypothetical protein